MPARTAPILVKKIRHLRRQGLQIGEIAREVGVGRGTVAKYADKVDTQTELEDAVGGLTAAQREVLMRLVELPVETIDLLMDTTATYQCSCGTTVAYFAAAERFRCRTCGKGYRIGPIDSAPPETPTAPRQASRAVMRPLRRGRGRG